MLDQCWGGGSACEYQVQFYDFPVYGYFYILIIHSLLSVNTVTAVQRQKVVSAYITGKQILH